MNDEIIDFLLARFGEQDGAPHPAGDENYWRLVHTNVALRRIIHEMRPWGSLDDAAAPEVLRLLAGIFASHPDFREEWR